MSQSQHSQSNHQPQTFQDNLSYYDMFSILKSRGFNIDSEKSISEPTSEFFNSFLVFSSSLLLKIPLEEINNSIACESIESEAENCTRAFQAFSKLRYIRQMLELVGVDEGVSSADIIKPEKKKVKRTVQIVTQFILHQESIIRNHIEILEKNRFDEVRLKRLQDELETLRFQTDQLREKKEAEKSTFKDKMLELERLAQEYQELLRKKSTEQKEHVEIQERFVSMEKAIFQADEDIRRMIEINEKEQQKIVKSPAKLKEVGAALIEEIERSTKELLNLKSEVQMLDFRRTINEKLMRKIKTNLTLPSLHLQNIISSDAEASRLMKAAKSDLKDLQSIHEKTQSQLQNITESHMELIAQIDAKNKSIEEKKKINEEEILKLTNETSQLKQSAHSIEQTINEINTMKKNVEASVQEQQRSHELFMKEKKRQMEELIASVEKYKNNLHLMLDIPLSQ